MAQLVQMELPLADRLVSPDGTLGTIFDFRKQKGKVSQDSQRHVLQASFPGKNQLLKQSNLHSSEGLTLKATPLHTLLLNHFSLKQEDRAPPPTPNHLHVLTHSCLGSCSLKPFLFLDIYLSLGHSLRSASSSSTEAVISLLSLKPPHLSPLCTPTVKVTSPSLEQSLLVSLPLLLSPQRDWKLPQGKNQLVFLFVS